MNYLNFYTFVISHSIFNKDMTLLKLILGYIRLYKFYIALGILLLLCMRNTFLLQRSIFCFSMKNKVKKFLFVCLVPHSRNNKLHIEQQNFSSYFTDMSALFFLTLSNNPPVLLVSCYKSTFRKYLTDSDRMLRIRY